MRYFFLYAVLFMFVANNLVLATWVKPCMLDNTQSVVVANEASSSENLPCHEEQLQQDTMQCDGVCLCLHALVSQTPVLDTSHLFVSLATTERIAIRDHNVISLISNPLYRPPILIS